MRNTPFKGLTEALSASSDWASIDSAWRESEDLLASLRTVLPENLAALVVQVRRGDPAKGIPQTLRAQGWGIQHVKVIAQREQDIAPPRGPSEARTPITPRVRRELGSLAQEMPNAALQRALKKIASRA